MMSKIFEMKRRAGALLIATTSVALCLPTQALALETVKVGVALRFAPERFSFASELYEGIDLATDDFNGKQNQIKIELVKYSHKEGHDSIDDAAKKIIKDGVHFVLGAEMSDDAFALAESFQGKEILLVTATASNPTLTIGHPNVFRTCYTDDQVAQMFAKYLVGLKTTAQPSAHSIGVLHNTVNAYTDFVTNAFLDAIEKYQNPQTPIQITEFRYATEHPDFAQAVADFKKAKVEYVIAFTLQESLKKFYQQAETAAYHPTYVGSDGWGPIESILAAFPHLHGIRSEFWNNTRQSRAITQFRSGYQTKFHQVPNGSNASAYDSAMILFESIAKAKRHQVVEEVATEIRSGTFQDRLTAPKIQFLRNNSAKKPLYLYEIKNGKSQFLKAVD